MGGVGSESFALWEFVGQMRQDDCLGLSTIEDSRDKQKRLNSEYFNSIVLLDLAHVLLLQGEILKLWDVQYINLKNKIKGLILF